MATTPLPFPQESTGSVGPAAPLPSGTAVAHLTIDRVLHEGLHNVVYLSHDPSGQPVALMEYFPRALALRQPDGSVRARQAGDAIALSVGREAFVVDANTLERLEHPGIVRVLGSLQAHRTVYRAMVFVDGPTLERHISARGPAASAGAVGRLLGQILDALDAMHRNGVVHGCVRPDQILLAAGERPVLLGMGSAGAEIVGHEAGPWTAPEQAAMSRHDRINSATDLYMAAATAWCYATGDAPPTLRERLADPEAWDPAAALAELPESADDAPGSRERLAAALSAALALLPSERPQRVADLRRLLRPGGASAAFEPAGTVPLWVGAMPDREAQWEVFEKEVVHGRPEAAHPPAAPSTTATDVTPKHRAAAEPPHAILREPDPAPAVVHDRPARMRWLWVALPVIVVAGLAGAGWWMLQDARQPTLTLTPALPDATVEASAPTPTAASAAAPVADTPPPPAPAPAPTAAADPVAVAPPPPAAAPPAAAPPAAAPPAAAPPAAAPPAPTTAPPAVPEPAPAPPRMVAAAKPKPAAPATPRSACANRSQFALLYCLQDQCSKPALRNHPQCTDLRRRGDIQ